MAAKVTWPDVVQVVRGLESRQEGPPVKGTFRIKTDRDLSALQACLLDPDNTHCELDDDSSPGALAVGRSVELRIAPRFGFGLLKHDMDALLKHIAGARIREPSFFLMSDDVSSTDAVSDDHIVSRYRAVLQLVQLLKRAAAFLDPDVPALVFIKDGKFELPVDYDESDLEKLPLSVIRDLLTVLPKGTHEKQCASILAQAVISLTERVACDQRFAYLLANAGELKTQFEQGYQLFAAGFSYEKILDQAETARVEYSAKIHKVFADIQNQLLGIPVATVIVATQMRQATAPGFEFWVNTAVLLGCWVFSVLMIFLLRNQGHTLGVLCDEIDRQQRQLKKEYAAVAHSFAGIFSYLGKRARAQRCILWFINVIVSLSLVFSTVIYFKLTGPARDWLVSCAPALAGWF